MGRGYRGPQLEDQLHTEFKEAMQEDPTPRDCLHENASGNRKEKAPSMLAALFLCHALCYLLRQEHTIKWAMMLSFPDFGRPLSNEDRTRGMVLGQPWACLIPMLPLHAWHSRIGATWAFLHSAFFCVVMVIASSSSSSLSYGPANRGILKSFITMLHDTHKFQTGSTPLCTWSLTKYRPVSSAEAPWHLLRIGTWRFSTCHWRLEAHVNDNDKRIGMVLLTRTVHDTQLRVDSVASDHLGRRPICSWAYSEHLSPTRQPFILLETSQLMFIPMNPSAPGMEDRLSACKDPPDTGSSSFQVDSAGELVP